MSLMTFSLDNKAIECTGHRSMSLFYVKLVEIIITQCITITNIHRESKIEALPNLQSERYDLCGVQWCLLLHRFEWQDDKMVVSFSLSVFLFFYIDNMFLVILYQYRQWITMRHSHTFLHCHFFTTTGYAYPL
jgi:hypothetical protein